MAGNSSRTFLGLVLLTMVCTVSYAQGHVLSGAQIRDRLIGKTITDGTHWSYALKSDGNVEAIDMGKARTGQWRIIGGELCIRVPRTASEDCWTVRRNKEQLYLERPGAEPMEILVSGG